MGFLVICSGVVLLQLSKSAKDVPDTAVFKGDLDQVRTVAEQEEPESEPKADAIRGTAAIIRRISQSRQKSEIMEARRVHEERMRDQMETIGENESVEWDGLRRRKTVIDGPASLTRRKTLHPPLGMTHFPEDWDETDSRPASTDVHGGGVFHGGLFDSFRGKSHRKKAFSAHVADSPSCHATLPQRPLTEINVAPKGDEDTAYHPPLADGAMEMGHVYGIPQGLQRSPSSSERQNARPIAWAQNVSDRPSASQGSLAAPTPPPHNTKRQFSFQNVFHRNRSNPPASPDSPAEPSHRPSSRLGLGSRHGSKEHSIPGIKTATEEERLGLVKGDSNAMLPLPDYNDRDDDDEYDDHDWKSEGKRTSAISPTGPSSAVPPIREEKEAESRGESPERESSRQGRTDLLPFPRRDDSRGGRGGGGNGPAFI